MHITALHTYPIKSLAGISLARTLVRQRGLAYDRRWMLVDSDGLFISQREFPQMALLQPTFSGPNLIIQHRQDEIEPLAIPLRPPVGALELNVQIWDDYCTALQVGREASQWFSEALHTQCRLVYMPDDSIRPLKPAYGQPGEHTSFADVCPLLIIGEASLSDLNQRLDVPVAMNRFRPNIVFAGGQPYEEEGWKNFRVGEVAFRGIRTCIRCQIITIDQQTAKSGKEPLRTLSTYRRQGNKVGFGLHASWIAGEGEAPYVQVGDEVEASPSPSKGGE